MCWPCHKSIAPVGGPFDPREPKFYALIVRRIFPWIMGFLVASFLLSFQHCIFSQGIFSFGNDLDKNTCKKCKLSRFSDQIDPSERQQHYCNLKNFGLFLPLTISGMNEFLVDEFWQA